MVVVFLVLYIKIDFKDITNIFNLELPKNMNINSLSSYIIYNDIEKMFTYAKSKVIKNA